jgi:hypothetical protein
MELEDILPKSLYSRKQEPIGMSMHPLGNSGLWKRMGADELLELEHFRLAGNFRIQEELSAVDHQNATDSEMATALPLTLRRED